jgi:hypothetical protein
MNNTALVVKQETEIKEEKTEPLHECESFLITDVAVHECECGLITVSGNGHHREYTPVDKVEEKTEKQEDQESLFDEMLSMYLSQIHDKKASGYEACKHVRELFTITRKS